LFDHAKIVPLSSCETGPDRRMRVTTQQLLELLTSGLFLFIFTVVAIRATRRRTGGDLDVALLFGISALAVSIGPTLEALGIIPEPADVAPLVVTLLLALPLLTLRAVRPFTRLHRNAFPLATVAWLIWSLVFVLRPLQVPVAGTSLAVAAFALIEGYAGIAVLRTTLRARGLARRRLVAITLGTLLLGAMILVAGVQIALPAAGLLFSPLALICASCYVIGFATPTFVRDAWQAAELRRFASMSLLLAQEQSSERVLVELATRVRETLGASEAAVALWDASRERVLRYWLSSGITFERDLASASAGPGFWERAHERPVAGADFLRTDPRLRPLDLRYVALAPIGAAGRLGVLAAFEREQSIFLHEDLELLRVLADQSLVLLEQRRLYEEVGMLNKTLELRLADLRAVNEELSSFAYAVSHDLQAPLRSIDVFSQVLLEDKSEALGADGRQHLDRVRAAAGQMSALIDDLLELARTTRKDLVLEEVELGPMAREVFDQLRAREPTRQVEFSVQGQARVHADASLLRIALTNLLGNAWKFTRGRSPAHIAVRAELQGDEGCVEVRDDGVGFDMRYADRLFTPFQRLHAGTDFEGTGVGLALVQRIVHRHGGRVWAEGAVGTGATFSFTLPLASPAAPSSLRQSKPQGL
jgi:signal transduction histidine kinase